MWCICKINFQLFTFINLVYLLNIKIRLLYPLSTINYGLALCKGYFQNTFPKRRKMELGKALARVRAEAEKKPRTFRRCCPFSLFSLHLVVHKIKGSAMHYCKNCIHVCKKAMKQWIKAANFIRNQSNAWNYVVFGQLWVLDSLWAFHRYYK